MRGATKAINHWVEHTETMLRLRAFGLRFMQHKLVQALNTWEARGDERRRMRAFISRCLNSQLAAAWGTWVGAADSHFKLQVIGNRMLQREILKAWNKWLGQAETFWQLQQIANRMRNSGLARGFDQWYNACQQDNALARKERGWFTYLHLRKLTRAWRLWTTNAHDQIARGRIRDTFRFSKPPEEAIHAEAVDWRQALNKGRTRQ